MNSGERFRHQVRVGYVDTDQGGIVHHSVFLKYLEAARVEFLRANGVVYRDFELDDQYGLPVVEANLRYKRPARFDDLLEIETWVGMLKRATLRFDYTIWCGDERLCDAKILLACIKMHNGRPRSIPDTIRDACQPGNEESS